MPFDLPIIYVSLIISFVFSPAEIMMKEERGVMMTDFHHHLVVVEVVEVEALRRMYVLNNRLFVDLQLFIYNFKGVCFLLHDAYFLLHIACMLFFIGYFQPDMERHNAPPSRVLHVRGLREYATQNDLVDAVKNFGRVSYVMMMTRNRQALVEFEVCYSRDVIFTSLVFATRWLVTNKCIHDVIVEC